MEGGDCSQCEWGQLGEEGRGFGVAEVVLRGFSSSLIAQFVGHWCAKIINYKGSLLSSENECSVKGKSQVFATKPPHVFKS